MKRCPEDCFIFSSNLHMYYRLAWAALILDKFVSGFVWQTTARPCKAWSRLTFNAIWSVSQLHWLALVKRIENSLSMTRLTMIDISGLTADQAACIRFLITIYWNYTLYVWWVLNDIIILIKPEWEDIGAISYTKTLNLMYLSSTL